MSAVTAPVLSDLIPHSRVKDAALVIGGTVVVSAAAQVVIPLWFTPVPLSLSTFGVLMVGAALGPGRAAASLLLYAALGLAGVPVFAGFTSGFASVSFGYVLGYILAAVAVGALARRSADRRVVTAALMAVVGSSLVYAAGVPWLIVSLNVGWREGLTLGVLPFLVGDVLKAVAAAACLPLAWKVVGSIQSK